MVIHHGAATNVKELMKEQNFAILDAQYIQSSKHHKCICKLYILAKDGYTDLELEFQPCKPFKELERTYQRSFRFWQHHIHKLTYEPSHKYAPHCNTVLAKINTFIVYNSIDCIFYHGGIIEKELCYKLSIPCHNIEQLMAIKREHSYNPQTEVNSYYHQCKLRLFLIYCSTSFIKCIYFAVKYSFLCLFPGSQP